MSSSEEILSSLGLDALVSQQPFVPQPTNGTLASPAGARVLAVNPEFMRSLLLVLDGEKSGAWSSVLKDCGRTCGKNLAADLDAELSAQGKPALAELPLEACLVFIERHFAAHGWGRLTLDLSDAAEHGLVIAHAENSFLAAALPAAAHPVDAFLSGSLQGFCEHLSGQSLGCEEIACARTGSPRCTFVITAPERIDAIRPALGQEPADAIIARLRG